MRDRCRERSSSFPYAKRRRYRRADRPPPLRVGQLLLVLVDPPADPREDLRVDLAPDRSKHAAGIFGKLDLAPSDDDNRRVLALLAYLGS